MILSRSNMIEAAQHAPTTAFEENSVSSSNSSSPSTSSSLFPVKLHAMLEEASREGFDDVVCWLHGGTTFKVLNPAQFTTDVMPKYFNQRKYKSFLRQLNLYGFQRIHHGPHKGGYAHKFFLQGHPNLCEKITKSPPKSKAQAQAHAHKRIVSFDASAPMFVDTNNNNMGASFMNNIEYQNQSPTMTPSHNRVLSCPPSIVTHTFQNAEGTAVSDLDDSANSSRSGNTILANKSFDQKNSIAQNNAMFTPLPVEAPVNAAMAQEAIQHLLPSSTNVMQTKPVNEIFNEEPVSFNTMDTQVEKALLSTFVSDEKEMEKALGSNVLDQSLTDELMAIVNDEPSPSLAPAMPPVMNNNFAPPMTSNLTSVPSVENHYPVGAMTGVSPLATGAVSEFNFPRKVYRMLDDSDKNPAYKEIVSWVEEGMAFKVHNKKQFVDKILPIYFDMTQYASFRRQLNMYSFDRKHTSTYSNPFFVRGCPDLLEKITRKSGGTSSKGNNKKN